MAKPGTPRHSKPARKPVTINLDPSDVKRVDEFATRQATPPAEPVGDFATQADQKPEAAKPASEPKPEKPPFTAGVKPEVSSDMPKATAAVPPQKQSALRAANLLAGVAGGVIALGGLLALQWGNVVPSPGLGVTSDELARIEQQLAELRSNPAPAPLDDASRTQFATLQKNVEAAEIKAEAVAGSLTEIQQQFAALPKVEESTAPIDLTPINERLASLEAQLNEAKAQADQTATSVSGNSGTLSSLEQKLAALEGRVSEAARQPDASALIAANALKTAIDRGGSFKAELETYASVASTDASVEALKAFADKGVPTLTELNSNFDAVAQRMIATQNKLPEDAGVWDQLIASAKGLVSVRPVAGNVEGDGVGPRTARMEAALQVGDLQRAFAEWEQLPADAKAVSEEFGRDMKARLDTDVLIQRVLADSFGQKTPANAVEGAAAPAAN